MAVAERLRRLRRIGLHEAGIAVRQIEGKKVDLLEYTADYRQGFAKVHLGMARRVMQRHEHLPRPVSACPHIIFDDGVAAGEPVLVAQPFVDPLHRMTLLAVNLAVFLQNPVDNAGISVQLRTPWRSLTPVARRHRKPQYLAHRLAVDPENPRRLTIAHPVDMARPSNTRI